MTKFKAVLAAAGALLATGAYLLTGPALDDAGLTEGMTRSEWCTTAIKANDIQRRERFFVAVAQGADIPNESDGRLLGECAESTCTIAPDAAPECTVTYEYDCGPLVNGWRICGVWGHPYFAKGWRNHAAESADFRWYGELSAAVTACMEHFTGPECLDLLQADRKCWLLDTGEVCRHGGLLGSEDPCPYARVAGRLPCTVYRGAGSEMTDALRVWTDEEMDEL